jgi:hypothetical protein
VLHGTADLAGQTGLSVLGLREIGVPADGYFVPNPYGYSLKPDFAPRASTRLLRGAERLVALSRAFRRYDTFHFHSGATFLPERLGGADARALRAAGRRVTVEFWGSDARLPALEAARNPYYVNAYAENDAANRDRLARWAGITGGHAVVSDHYMKGFLDPFFSRVHVVGQRVDTRRFAPAYPSPAQRRPVLVHAPSRKAAKGTRFVEAAVERLRARGLAFEYVEVHDLPHARAVEAYARADLIVDQLTGGSHGVFAVEAMAMGKPVICYILPELVPTYPEGFPIINANPDTVAAVLEEWLQRPEERHALGVRSREYAERVHDCRNVARRLVRAYEAL